MKKFLAAATLAALSLTAPAMAEQHTGFGPLITADGLADDASAPLVLDIRSSDAYAAGHIPQAVNAPYGLFRGPQDNPGQLPGEDKLTEVLQSLGVTTGRPTVVVHQGNDQTDFGAAARVYWTLKSSGVSQLAILNGGMNAWTAAKRDVSTDAVTPAKSDITVSFSHEWLATTDDVKAIVNGDTQSKLVDARPEAFWAGNQAHPAAARPGTLPQSQYFTHSNWFSSDPTLIDAAAARDLAQSNGFQDSDHLVSFCNTGHWAATNWFALSELAGIDDVKLYPESMVGWSNAGLPMDNVPGPLRNLWNQVKSVF